MPGSTLRIWVVAGLLGCAGIAQAAIPASERTVLLNLYASTNGATWTTKTNWNGAPGTECTWYGVVCNAGGTTVTRLNFRGNSLTGSLPSNLNGLTNLISFDAGNNQLTGSIPALTGLTNLAFFRVDTNQLTGLIPALTGLTQLTNFLVYNNQLYGKMPSVPSPGALQASGSLLCPNYLDRTPDPAWDLATGTTPWHTECTGIKHKVLVDLYNSTGGPTWTKQTNWNGPPGTECGWFGVTCNVPGEVIGIDLRGNNLTGSLPNNINGLTSLASFDAGSNHLSGSIPALTGLTSLVNFRVGSNQLTGSIPTLTGLTNLQYLYVNSNQLTGPIPALAGLTSLAFFSVGFNQLTGPIPALASVTKLVLFVAARNQLTGSIPTLAGLTNLQYLYVNSNQLTGSIPALAGLTNLAEFAVYGNHLTGQIPALTGLSKLVLFWVDNNHLTGQIPALTGLTSLKSFSVNSNQLTGNAPSVPSPSALAAGESSLCPNFLNHTPDPQWDVATGVTPWHTHCAAVPPVLDVDASLTATKYDALTDGVLVIRYLVGLTGPSLTGGALGPSATRTDPAAIKAYLDAMRPALDIDGNGTVDAPTDGLLTIRYLFGLRGAPLIAGAVDAAATRKTAEAIEAYLQILMR